MAIYNFVDTTTHTSTAGIPAEAVAINGYYIEDQVAGFRTLYATGRDVLEPEAETEDPGKRDGSVYKYKRFPERKIVVGYQLTAETPAQFRERFNQLNKILNVEQATLIFADEQDKFFIGTPSGADQPDEGLLNITSEYEITCADPFKYSVTEYEVSPTLDDGKTFAVEYNGTIPTHPTLTASFTEDCGFVAFVSDDEAVVQVGDVNEADTAENPASQTLINETMTSIGSAWTQNAGAVISGITLTGTMSVLTDPASKKLAGASGIGSGTGYHGPSIIRSLPADASSHVGASDFRYTWKQRFAMTNKASAQYGFSQVLLINNDNGTRTVVAGVGFYKNRAGSTHARYFYINGRLAQKKDGYNATYTNKPYGFASGSPMACSIQKKGATVTFNIGTSKYSFTNEDIETLEVNEIQFGCGGLGSVTRMPANQIGLISHKFIKDNCDTFVDIPNKFSEDDVVEIDTAAGEVTLNGTPMPEYGAIGNQFEEFVLEPGANQVTSAYSEWVTNGPTLTLKYREKFI